MIITSRQNPKVKALLALGRRRDRQEAGVTLVEGFEELALALQSGVRVQTFYYCPELMANDAAQATLLGQVLEGATETIELSRSVFERVAYRQSPDGWLAVVPAIETRLKKLDIQSENPLILVCEGVEKPGNIGAMLRTADAAGVDAVIATESVTDWSNPNIVRASKGTIFSVPIAESTNDELLEWFQDRKINSVASTPNAKQNYTNVGMSGPTAILMGTEKYGLSDFWLQRATHQALIPMKGRVNSLNVATAAALFVYEAVRQRS